MLTASGTPHDHGIHRLALGLFTLIIAGWLVTMLLTVRTAGQVDEGKGALLAVFPRGISEVEVLTRVAQADGVVMRGTWFGNVWHVYGDQADFAAALRAHGAVLVLPPVAGEALSLGGCGYAPVPRTDRPV